MFEVIQSVVFRDPDEVLSILGEDFDGTINTAYIEGIHFTLRNSLARFIRKTMSISKNMKMRFQSIDFFQVWHNFVRPHKSLRIIIRNGKRRWKQSALAMAEGLTNHVRALKEPLTFKISVQ